MPTRVLMIAVVAVLAACGSGDDKTVTPQRQGGTSTLNVEMVDIDFKPESIQVQKGETVRFVFTNSGRVQHEAFIGDAKAQEEHEQEMRDGGHSHHGMANAVVVEPGGTAELTYTFDQAGLVEIGCHEPGHYPVGMKIEVEVV